MKKRLETTVLPEHVTQARHEIRETLKLCFSTMDIFGMSFEKPKKFWPKTKQNALFVLAVFSLGYHLLSDLVYITNQFAKSPKVSEIVPFFPPFGYGIFSVTKMFTLWYKKDVLSQLLEELAEIWPVAPRDLKTQEIKDKSLAMLKYVHRWHHLITVHGVLTLIMAPILIYLYHLVQHHEDVKMGFIWFAWYPFDRSHPAVHALVFIFEAYIGKLCASVVTSTDLLFSTMTNHIALLLRLLSRKLEAIGYDGQNDDRSYEEIVTCVKLHQRLIRYCDDVEEAFTVSNFMNIMFSSVIICCVSFVILVLEPISDFVNKIFLSASITQIAIICNYADLTLNANAEITTAAYNSGWYRTSPRCRRALSFIIERSQKPIAFTAMKFNIINLQTFATILTRSYSLFTVLYAMFTKN